MFSDSRKVIDEIFGVKRTPATLSGMNIRYSALGQRGTTEHICCDENGQYYLAAAPEKGGHTGSLGLWAGSYTIDEQIIMPISRQSALRWADTALCGNELESAMKELGKNWEHFDFLWEVGTDAATAPADVHEWLGKYDAENFVLLSTDDSYPFCGGTTTLALCKDGATLFEGEVYVYYIPAATACRWAELHGTDADTCATVFGLSEA